MISATKRLQTYALDCAATGIGTYIYIYIIYISVISEKFKT
jgi:hypothetical protein